MFYEAAALTAELRRLDYDFYLAYVILEFLRSGSQELLPGLKIIVLRIPRETSPLKDGSGAAFRQHLTRRDHALGDVSWARLTAWRAGLWSRTPIVGRRPRLVASCRRPAPLASGVRLTQLDKVPTAQRLWQLAGHAHRLTGSVGPSSVRQCRTGSTCQSAKWVVALAGILLHPQSSSSGSYGSKCQRATVPAGLGTPEHSRASLGPLRAHLPTRQSRRGIAWLNTDN